MHKKEMVAAIVVSLLVTACGNVGESLFQKQYEDVLESISNQDGADQDSAEKDGTKEDGPDKDYAENPDEIRMHDWYYAIIDDTHTGTIEVEGQDDIVIHDVIQAVLFEDKLKLIYLNTNNELILSSVDMSSEKTLATGVGYFYVGDLNAVYYRDLDRNFHVCRYKDAAIFDLGEFYGKTSAFGNRYVYFVDQAIYYLDSDADEPVKLADTLKTHNICYVNNDGSVICWYDYDDHTENLYMYANGEVKLLASEQDDSSGIRINYMQNDFSVLIQFYDRFFVIVDGKPVIDLTISDELRGYNYYSAKGKYVALKEGDDIGTLYSVGSKVCYYDEQGNAGIILDDIRGGRISNNELYYIDQDNNLYSAHVDGNTISSEAFIDKDACEVITALNGLVYYTKYDTSYGIENYSLYIFNAGDGSIREVSDFVYCRAPYLYADYFYVTEDGKYSIYFKVSLKAEYPGCKSDKIMDMYLYDYDKDEETLISEGVYGNSLSVSDGYLDKNYFSYGKYNGVNETDDEVCYDIYLFDGNTSSLIYKNFTKGNSHSSTPVRY